MLIIYLIFLESILKNNYINMKKKTENIKIIFKKNIKID